MRLFLWASTFAFVLAGCAMEDRDLTLAVSVEEPAPSIAETISSILGDRGYTISIDSTIDPSMIVAAVRDRKIDLALVEEPEIPVSGVVTLAPLYPSVLHVLHNRLETAPDFTRLIRGAKIYAGPPGGAAHRLLIKLSADFDVSADQIRILDNPWTEKPDVYFIFGGLLSSDSVEQLEGYRLFSFADADDVAGGSVADGIALKHHHLKPFILPKSVYYTLNNKPVVTFSIRSVLIAHEDFNIDFALDIASQLFNKAQEIAMSDPLVTRELNSDANTVELMFPLHAGTKRYLDRDKPGFIERHVDVLALGLTLLATLLTGAIALYRHRLQVRKDRVDVYYSHFLEIRRDMEATNNHDLLLGYYKRALDVQHEVLNLLIDERIAADASLLAFISLSNQIINELDRQIGHVSRVSTG